MKHTLTVIPASFSKDPSSEPVNSLEVDLSSPAVAEESSLAHTPKITTMNGNQYSHQRSQHEPWSSYSRSPPPDSEPMKSPCFVHSHLDKGVSLSEWLRHKQGQTAGGAAQHPGVTRNLHRTHDSRHQYQQEHNAEHGNGSGYATPSDSVIADDINDEDEYGSSLTKQLAETAVGVRKMSRELGRTRVRSNIQTILIITKARDNRLIKLTRELAVYLMLKPRHGASRGMVVYVDSQLRNSRRFDAARIKLDHPELFEPFPRRRSSSSTSTSSTSSAASNHKEDLDDGQLRYWTSDMCRHSPHLFDFVVTLGGDGTVLFTSWLFQRIVPPVLPFALGSLGFLTNFDFAEHQAVMDSAIDSGVRVNLRMRFTCTVYRVVALTEGNCRKAVKKADTGEIMMKNVEKGGWEALEGGWSGGHVQDAGKGGKDKEIMCFTTRPVETFEVLNDLVVDRGPSPYVSQLELFGDEHHMTTVQADGLTISTPTGSTAYSLSAGGSLVHPEIPAILITPICPHTLSFRPMLLPDSMELRISVPFNSRSTAWASFDGRGRVELKQGDHIKVTASKYPFPTVCADNQSVDWFHSISRTLKWNERERQKSFVVVEEGPAKPRKRRHGKSFLDESEGRSKRILPEATQEVVESEGIDNEEDEVSDEAEDDGFDINDSSPEAAECGNLQTRADQAIGKEKAAEVLAESRPRFPVNVPDDEVAFMHVRESRSRSKLGERSRSRPGTRSRSRSSQSTSGVETPGRYAGPRPNPPRLVHPRSNLPAIAVKSSSSSPSSTDSLSEDTTRHGAWDDIRTPHYAHLSNRSQILHEKDVKAESMNLATPVAREAIRRGHVRSVSADHHHPRAFAVWGQDESDSNASDSDA